ncbi:MAG: hypothetical protein V7K27_28730 [Nostoc sp.]
MNTKFTQIKSQIQIKNFPLTKNYIPLPTPHSPLPTPHSPFLGMCGYP